MEDKLKTNMEYMNDFLNTIEKEFRIHCIKRRYDSGYYLDIEDNCICSFKIKEIPDFTFGLWMSNLVDLNYYDASYKNSKLIFFTQPTVNIDKFKPSRSSFCLPIERYIETDSDTDEQYYTWWLTEVELMIRALRHNKIKSFYKADYSGWEFYDDVSYFKALKYYISSYYLHYKNKIAKNYRRFIITSLIKFKFRRLKNVRAYLYYEKNWSPGLSLAFCVKPNITEKEDNKLTKIDDFFDKYFFMEISLKEYDEDEYFDLLRMFNDERKSVKNLWMKT